MLLSIFVPFLTLSAPVFGQDQAPPSTEVPATTTDTTQKVPEDEVPKKPKRAARPAAQKVKSSDASNAKNDAPAKKQNRDPRRSGYRPDVEIDPD